MSDTPVVGSAAFELRVNKKKAQEDVREFERDFKQSLGGIEAEGGKAAGGIGGAFSKLGLTMTAGLAAVAAAAAYAVATLTRLSFEGVRLAASIEKSAGAIGISTNALQEWRYVAQRTGADARDADKALDGFATKLAQATAGTSKEASKAFGLLGFDRDDLRQFASVEQAVDVVTDSIKDLKSEASRAAVAEALGLGALSNALRDGAVDIAHLRDEARGLGVVMDAELIRRAGKAQEEFETLSQVIDVQLKSAFIDLAPVIMQAISLVARLATALSDAMDNFRRLDDRTERGLRTARQLVIDDQARLMLQYGSVDAMRSARVYNPLPPGSAGSAAGPGASISAMGAGESAYDRWQANAREIDRLNREISERVTANSPPARTDRTTGGSLTLPPPRADNSAQREAEREARRAERVEQEIFRAKQRLLDVTEGDLLTAEQRYDLARDQLEMDRQARDAEIESKLAREEYTQGEADKLRLAHEQADVREDEILLERSILEIRDEELANAKMLSDLTADLLSLQSGAARTAAERRRIELELLEIAQKNRRDALEQQINKTPGLSEQDKVALWAANGRIEQGERNAVIRNNMGPLDQWRDASIKSAGEVQEAFERIAVDGLDALNDGLVDAIMNSRNLGEVFSNVARSILADLLKISIRQGIVEPLAGAIFGGSEGGGGGSWLKSALGSFLGSFGRRAAGGPVSAGTPYIVGENRAELFVPSVNGTILPDIPGTGAAQAQRFRLEVDLKNDLLDARIVDTAAPLAGQAAVAAVTIQRGESRMAQRRARQRFV